jgi:hypothetical protein
MQTTEVSLAANEATDASKTPQTVDETPPQMIENGDPEAERLTREFHEQLAQEALEHAEAIPVEQEPDDYTEDDAERDFQFACFQAARDAHFALLEATDKQEKKYPPFEYLVDGLLPLNEVHVIAGETGAGKSTWLFDNFIDPWQREKAVLGRRSHWLPYVIFVNDRTKAGMVRVLQRLKLNPKQFPIESTITGGDLSVVDKIKRFHDATPN